MNRENKRKQYEKGYYKTHPCTEVLRCKICGREVFPDGRNGDQNGAHSVLPFWSLFA